MYRMRSKCWGAGFRNLCGGKCIDACVRDGGFERENQRDSEFQSGEEESASVQKMMAVAKLGFHIEMRPVGFAPHQEEAHVT